ncbi:MAG: VOC family protein [Rhodospirillaceae bacterium]|jgi:catechol 2,3-dioxygenase-like lactoylglutathione lyase family enzyme|nr:VOC family protein [Rhodospirillaceae bacterium]MBT6203672.1 VOC family protein [Rhodospirillaceae bacterium]MBT6513017.1 VOC family protein [Rhodospirillaceae bacterium]MBT7615411.1 VOC family protein [Rhodospirillaceae bacterium]MBT7645507.1 VOC family protein [Rhodospirillaceae bacterium]
MYSHITLGTNDLDKATEFYDATLKTLGFARTLTMLEHGLVAYGPPRQPAQLFICLPYDGKAATVGNGTHVALLAPDRRSVDAFHAAVLAAGGADEGAPGPRPDYHEHYYGAYVRDLDGNKLQACCHTS